MKEIDSQRLYDLLIIGGGPAGLTAGIYAARKNLKTAIISKDTGQAGKAFLVENWPGIQNISGLELVLKIKEHLSVFKINFIDNQVVVKIEKDAHYFTLITDKVETFKSKAVIVASGRNPRPLKVIGEEKYLGKGVSYCSICDAPLFSEKPIAIIGGGNSGYETAIEMASRKSSVYIIEAGSKTMADEALIDKVSNFANIEIITQAILKEIKGDDFVQSLIYFDKKTKEEKELKVQGVFVETGSIPVVDFMNGLADCNEKGEIVINHSTGETKTPGLFAAGDVTDVLYKQIIIAAGEGAKAALSAYNYLNNGN